MDCDLMLKNLGSRLNKIRIKNNMSIELLSDKSGVSRHTIYNIENSVVIKSTGKINDPKIYTLASLAEALGVSLDYLIYGRNFNKNKIETLEDADKYLWMLIENYVLTPLGSHTYEDKIYSYLFALNKTKLIRYYSKIFKSKNKSPYEYELIRRDLKENLNFDIVDED